MLFPLSKIGNSLRAIQKKARRVFHILHPGVQHHTSPPSRHLLSVDVLALIARHCDTSTRHRLARTCRAVYRCGAMTEILYTHAEIANETRLSAFARLVGKAEHRSDIRQRLAFIRHFTLKQTITFGLPYRGSLLPRLRNIRGTTSDDSALFPSLRSVSLSFDIETATTLNLGSLAYDPILTEGLTRTGRRVPSFLGGVTRLHLLDSRAVIVSNLNLPLCYLGIRSVNALHLSPKTGRGLPPELWRLISFQSGLRQLTIDVESQVDPVAQSHVQPMHPPDPWTGLLIPVQELVGDLLLGYGSSLVDLDNLTLRFGMHERDVAIRLQKVINSTTLRDNPVALSKLCWIIA